MLKKKRTISPLVLLFLALAILPMVSASVSLTDTILTNAPYNNLTLNFTQEAFVDSATIETTSIYLENFRRSGNEYISFNLTQANKNYTGNDLPYFAQSSSTTKTIVSNLSSEITTNLIFDLATPYRCADIKSISINGYSSYDCSNINRTITMSGIAIPTGSSTITIRYAAAAGINDLCDEFAEGIGLLGRPIGMVIVILGILIVLAGLTTLIVMLREEGTEGGSTMQTVGITIIGIFVLIVLLVSAMIVTNIACNIT